MVARSATTHRSGLRGDAPASIESVSTTAQPKGQVSSSSSKMRSQQQGLKKSNTRSIGRKKEHASRIPNHTKTASRSTKKSHKSMAATSKGTTVKMRPKKSVAAKSKATARTGTSKARPAKQKRVEEEIVPIEEKASTKASPRKPTQPISTDTREDIESTALASSEKEHANTSSSRKPSSSIPSKKTAETTSKMTHCSAVPSKKSNSSTKKSSRTANKSRGSEVRSSKPAPTIKSVKSTKSAFSRLSTKIKRSRKVPSSSLAKTSLEEDEEDENEEAEGEEVEVNDEEIEEEGEDIHELTTKHSRSYATSSRHQTTSKNASKSRRSGSSRRSSSHQETYTYDDSTVSTDQTRQLPEITFPDMQCNRLMADTYEEMGKYAIKPLGLAVVRCVCGPDGDNALISHQRSYSEPIYKQGKPPASSTVGLNSIHHHPDCPSHHHHDSHADASSSPTSGGSPRPSEYANDDGELLVEKPVPLTEGVACEQTNLDQIVLQGIFEQYDEFVSNSKVAANDIVNEMQDMSIEKIQQKANSLFHRASKTTEKVQQKAESLGNTMNTLFQSASKTTRPNLAVNKWKDGASYTHRNQVTIMTPSEEAQDDWESGHVQLRLTESQQHLTESCEPRNPYARLDAVEVIDDSTLKASLPPVPEDASVEDEEVADKSAYFEQME